MDLNTIRVLFDDWDIKYQFTLILPSHSRLIHLCKSNDIEWVRTFYSVEEFVKFMEHNPNA